MVTLVNLLVRFFIFDEGSQSHEKQGGDVRGYGGAHGCGGRGICGKSESGAAGERFLREARKQQESLVSVQPGSQEATGKNPEVEQAVSRRRAGEFCGTRRENAAEQRFEAVPDCSQRSTEIHQASQAQPAA